MKLTPDSDARLLEALKYDDSVAFRHIYERHWFFVYNLAYKRTGDACMSEDLVQDIFTSLWEKRASLKVDNLQAYLASSVKYRIFDALAKQKTVGKFLDTLEELNAEEQSDHALISAELWDAYRALLEKLPENRRSIFKLRFEEELSPEAIAAKLRRSKKTVQNQLCLTVSQVQALIHVLLLFWFSR